MVSICAEKMYLTGLHLSLMIRFLVFDYYAVVAQNCRLPNVTTYLRSEHLVLREFPQAIIEDATLNDCAKQCTNQAEAVNCRSFQYDSSKQTCSLNGESGQPFGPSVLTKTNDGSAFFQQICISMTHVCPSPYIFERFPQHVLIGHALEVITTGDLSDCLRQCMESQRRLNIDCRSVMYYYETGECILNRDSAREHGQLFSNQTQGQLVDYFENNCLDLKCFEPTTTLHWIKSEQYSISDQKDILIEDLVLEKCRQTCSDNQLDGQNFPCKSFVYSNEKRQCHLSAESGLLLQRIQKIAKMNNPNSIDQQLSLFSSGQYFEKICLLPGTHRCHEASFELTNGHRLMESADMTLYLPSVSACLSACLQNHHKCHSVMYFYETEECVLNERTQFSHPELFRKGNSIDYFDNICEILPNRAPEEPTRPFAQVTTTLRTTTAAVAIEKPSTVYHASSNRTRPRVHDVSNSFDLKPVLYDDLNEEDTSRDQAASAKTETLLQEEQSEQHFVSEPPEPLEKPKGRLETECGLDGITVTAQFNRSTTGAVFIKDHFSTCRVEFAAVTQGILELPFPRSADSNPPCPGLEIRPNVWSFVIVVQRNEIGAPALMTANDRIFNVTCDYTNTPADTASQLYRFDATTAHSHFALSERKRIRMVILRDAEPVSTVVLGEELELKWIVLDSSDRDRFLVDECLAERLDGPAPVPAPLIIISHGCPHVRVRNQLLRYPIVRVDDGFSTKLQVFRFDGSRRVRIRCTVNICEGHCKPTSCDSTFGEMPSYGRRRKRQAREEMARLVRKIRPDFLRKASQISNNENTRILEGALTIVDELDETKTLHSAAASVNDLEIIAARDSICIQRPVFVALLIFIVILSVLQLFSILHIVYHKLHKSSNVSTTTSDTSSSGLTSILTKFQMIPSDAVTVAQLMNPYLDWL